MVGGLVCIGMERTSGGTTLKCEQMDGASSRHAHLGGARRNSAV